MAVRPLVDVASSRRSTPAPSLLFSVALVLSYLATGARAEFICAGRVPGALPAAALHGAAKPARTATGGIRAIVIFAGFTDDGRDGESAPAWSARLLDPDLPGSFSHFYRTMSLERFRPLGQVASRRYRSRHTAAAYVSRDPHEPGQYGRFSADILAAADVDLDFALFDSDGPDGVPNSGDDDGIVDAVFLVLDRVPANFLHGAATGIAGLGLVGEWETDDQGTSGQPLRVSPIQGAVLQGRTFAETAGIMCHEYGHVLGLPDLYDVGFIRQSDDDPAHDSAGIGRWGLMGWGATGWHEDDGPNSFCAWSRVALGWATVHEVSQEREELRLAEVGQAGDVFRIPMGASEYFLLEHRRHTSSHYDRHLPGEGLLIWHQANGLDLECADGLWRDAGFPLGEEPDPAGGDNLDFWAHDAAYTASHGGNQGDATDPFDGERYTAFTADTNPPARDSRLNRSIRIEGIHVVGDTLRAQVRTQPAQVVLLQPTVMDASGDGILTAGEEAEIRFYAVNRGGLLARDVRATLTTDDPLIDVLDGGEMHLGDISVGRASGVPTGGSFPRIRVSDELAQEKVLTMALTAFSGGTVVDARDVQSQGVFSYHLSGRVVDERGDGVPGIYVRLNGYNGGHSATLTSAADGSFGADLPPGSYSFSTQAGQASYARTAGSVAVRGDTDLRIALADGFPLSGTVTDEAGSPVGQVHIMATWGSGFASTASASDGGYSLIAPHGRLDLTAYRYASTPEAEFPTQDFKAIHIDGPRRFDMVLVKGVAAEFRCVDPEGRGVGGVFLLPGRATSGSTPVEFTDATGIVRLRLVPGVYMMSASHYPSSSATDQHRLAQSWVPLVEAVTDTVVQLPLQRMHQLNGTFTDPGARPHFTTTLRFTPLGEGRYGACSVAADGTYEASLLPGQYEVSLSPGGLGSTPAQTLGTVAVTGDGAASFTADPGVPVTGVLSAAPGDVAGATHILAASPSARASAATALSPDGLFELYLKPGRYSFTAMRGDTSSWSLGEFDVQSGDHLELQPPGGASLSGVVLDSRGHPLSNARIILARDPLVLTESAYWSGKATGLFHDGTAFAAATSTDNGGGYVLSAPSGEYSAIILPSRWRGLGMVGNVSLSTNTTRSFTLPDHAAYHQVYGRVLGEPGVPCGQVVLLFYCPATGQIRQHSTGGAGSFLLNLPSGTYQVRAGLSSNAFGFYKTYDLGTLPLDRDRRWDIQLDAAATAVAETQAAQPRQAALWPNYPNPFNPSTTIRYQITEPARVEVDVYDILGRRVIRLQREFRAAGEYRVVWHGVDDFGRPAASGVYICRLTAASRHGRFIDTRKLLLLR